MKSGEYIYVEITGYTQQYVLHQNLEDIEKLIINIFITLLLYKEQGLIIK